MRVTYEQFARSVLCLSRCIQKIQRTVMAKYGLMGAHAQCLLIMSRYPEGITAAQLSQISDKDKAAKYAQLLYAQALLIADLPLEDPSAYTDLVCRLVK